MFDEENPPPLPWVENIFVFVQSYLEIFRHARTTLSGGHQP